MVKPDIAANQNPSPATLSFAVPDGDVGARLDQFLAGRTDFSRARLARWLKDGRVTVHGQVRPPSYRVRLGDLVALTVPPPEPTALLAEPLPLEIIYEDADLIVVNKPPGLVTHPGVGHRTGTLLNALLAHCPELAEVGDLARPGLVHRLDKDTSGLIVAAKTAAAHAALVKQFQAREVEKTYLALVWGRMPAQTGEMAQDIGRHPTERKKMSAHPRKGKPALTRWRVLQEFPGPLTLVELYPKTGRTHQLRVHLTALGHPIVGDSAYGGGATRLKAHPALQALKPLVTRQLLHARRLGFTHPRTGEPLSWEAPLPEDFLAVVTRLKNL